VEYKKRKEGKEEERRRRRRRRRSYINSLFSLFLSFSLSLSLFF